MNENELDSTCGVSDEDLTRRFVEAVRIENEIKRIKGTPTEGYDIEKTGFFGICRRKKRICSSKLKSQKLLSLRDRLLLMLMNGQVEVK